MADTDFGEIIDSTVSIPVYRYNFDTLQEYLDIGEKLACDGRHIEAADVFEEATLRYESDASMFLDLGISNFLALRDLQSRRDLWEDITLEEDLAERCVAALQAAVARDAALTPAYNLLGRIYAIRGRHEDAIEAWTTSLAIDPRQDRVRDEMAFFRGAVMRERDRDLESELSQTRKHHWNFFRKREA